MKQLSVLSIHYNMQSALTDLYKLVVICRVLVCFAVNNLQACFQVKISFLHLTLHSRCQGTQKHLSSQIRANKVGQKLHIASRLSGV